MISTHLPSNIYQTPFRNKQILLENQTIKG